MSEHVQPYPAKCCQMQLNIHDECILWGAVPFSRILASLRCLKKEPFLCTVPKKKSALFVGAGKAKKKCGIRGERYGGEENVFGYFARKQ